MGVVLPDELAWLLDLIGVHWPNVDEDEFYEMATALRSFADEVDNGRAGTVVAVQRMVAENLGAATTAFEAHWNKLNGTHLHNLAEGGRMLATALDGVALVIAGAKGAAVVQLGILAGEVVAAQAAAPFTFGLSEFGALGATQITRIAVKKLLKEAEQQIVAQLMEIAKAPIMNALAGMAADLAIQAVSISAGVQSGVNWKSVAGSGVEGAKETDLGAAVTGGGNGGHPA
ncbi:hypothetical protein [Kitasatospora sp. NPDC006786]|uniref:WXG100-like domain-containing protein n=1 Tax=unclassified Kitasatospora TaxID=2633591 RepID=UPI0033FCF276